MRKLGDTQLVLRLWAFLWSWHTVKNLMGECDFVTNLRVRGWVCECVWVCVSVFHQLTPVFPSHELQCVAVVGRLQAN